MSIACSSQRTVSSRPISRGLRPVDAVKVLHVINGEHYAGAERVQDLLALHLKPCGFAVGFACLKPGRFPELRQSRQSPLHDVSMRHRLDLSTVWKVARIVRRDGYKLIHSHSPRSALIGGLASTITGVPLVHHVHSPTARDTAHPWQNRANVLAERTALGRASALIAVSESLGEQLRGRGFVSERISIVPNGVPARRPVPRRNPEKSTWTLGTMALFRPRKGVEVLLEALAALRRQGSPVRLRAVGSFESPQYEVYVKQLCRDLGLTEVVDWTGFAQDIDQELAKMDVFVLPSLFGEGLPMVLLEAMSAGLPIVASRVEGIPEAVRDGREGLLVEPGNAADLADSLARIIRGELDCDALRSASLHRHGERFSESRMAADVAVVYRRVLGQ
jgi:glycosyltransferase involved in cell wall biosynthesis